MHSMITKSCTRCLENKPLTEFWKHPGARMGLTPRCKPCHRITAKEWRDKNPEKLAIKQAKNAEYERNHPAEAFNRRLKYTHGIDKKEWDSMYSSQNGCCAICERHSSELSRVLQVDHNHATGEIRGLLCTKCNTRLAAVEDEKFSKRAIIYLNKVRLRLVGA